MPTMQTPRRLDAPPKIMMLLAATLALDVGLLQRFWSSAMRSGWSNVVSWRQKVEVYESVGDPEQLATTIFAPAQVMAILEALVQGRLLERYWATQIEEALLAKLDAEGQYV